MFFLLFLTLQGAYTYSWHGLYRRVPPQSLVYRVVVPMYVAEVPPPLASCLVTARGLFTAGLLRYPEHACWNKLIKYKDPGLLVYPLAQGPTGYNNLVLTGPIAYGQSSSWSGSYGAPSLLGGVSASAQASASASAGGLGVSSSSSSSANASSSSTSGSYGYTQDLTSNLGSSSISSSSLGSGGSYGGLYTGSGGGATRPTSTNPTSAGCSSNYNVNRPTSTGSVCSGVYYTGYNVPSSTVSSTSTTSHPPGYYTAFYKPSASGVNTAYSGGQDGQYNTYYYQPISSAVMGSGSGSSASSGAHYTGTGNYYTVYQKPPGTGYYVGTTTGTNPSVGTTSSTSTSAGGTSGSYPYFSGSQSYVHPTAGLQPSYSSQNKPQTGVIKPWWLLSGVFAASLASSSTFGLPSQVLQPANETGSSSWSTSTGVLGSLGNTNSGTSASGTVASTSTTITSESGTSSTSDITSNLSAGSTSALGVGSESTISSSNSGSGTSSVSSSEVSSISSSISNVGSNVGGTYGLSSSNMSVIGTVPSLGTISGSTASTTTSGSGTSTSSVAMPSLETGHVPGHENIVDSFSNATSLVGTSSSSMASSGTSLGTSQNGSSGTGGVSSAGYTPTTVSYLTNTSEVGAVPVSTAIPSLYNNSTSQATTSTPISLNNTAENSLPWWVSNGLTGISSPFGTTTGSGSSSSASSSSSMSTLGTNSGSTAPIGNVNGSAQANLGTDSAVNNVQIIEGTAAQTGSTTNIGGSNKPWWISGGLFGGNGTGSTVTSGSSVGSLTDSVTGSGGSSSVSTGSGSITSTGESSASGSVLSGSSVSSSGSSDSSKPWWLSGLVGGGGSSNSTGSSIGSTVGSSGSTVSSILGNNTVSSLVSNSQQNAYNSSGGSIAETLGGLGSSVLSNGIGGLASLQGGLTGSSVPSWLSSLTGQSQTGGSSGSSFGSATGSGISSLPGAPTLPYPFDVGQSGIPSIQGSSALSSATSSASSSTSASASSSPAASESLGSIMNPTNIGGIPNKPDHPWWQSSGLTGLGSSPYLKSSGNSMDNVNTDTVSKTSVLNTVSPTKSVELSNFPL